MRATIGVGALFMNRPTPDPSEEGSRHWSAPCQFPSWEGSGVVSWSQCIRKKRKGAFHEPYDALLANEQVIHPGFMVPMHSKKRKGASHEQTHAHPSEE